MDAAPMDAALPLDIWWLVCAELTAKRDFDALFNLARASRTMANLALPNLYSIHELASISADDASVTGKQKLATLWRAIILSSTGQTAFPYCLWIQNLKLGDLKELLSDIAPYPELRRRFFAGAMAPYERTLQLKTAANVATRRSRPRLDLQGISNQVGEAVTRCVQEAAARDNRAVALTHLEGQHIPVDLLPDWTARLATLMSLHIQDGSVLGAPVAASIRDHCPRFCELTCFYCDGPAVDEDLAAFFRTLRPRSLAVFRVSSKNRLGREALAALALRHAPSLRRLGLSDLQGIAFEHLGAALRPCVALEALELEAERSAALDWPADYPASFADAAAWLGACASLASLRLWNVPGAAALLQIVLRAPALRLTSLDLKLVDADADADADGNNGNDDNNDDGGLYASLGHQTALEGLFVRSSDPRLDHPSSPQHAQLLRSIGRCRRLRVLDIMQTMVFAEELGALAAALADLEELSLDGDQLGDAALDDLLAMRKLKTVNINASTVFTVDGLLRYINRLGALGPSRGGGGGGGGGVSLTIMNQSLAARISPEEEQFLSEHAWATMGGRIEIAHPEEEHESDFSD